MRASRIWRAAPSLGRQTSPTLLPIWTVFCKETRARSASLVIGSKSGWRRTEATGTLSPSPATRLCPPTWAELWWNPKDKITRMESNAGVSCCKHEAAVRTVSVVMREPEQRRAPSSSLARPIPTSQGCCLAPAPTFSPQMQLGGWYEVVDEAGGFVGLGRLKMFHGLIWFSQGRGFVIILQAEGGSGTISGMKSRNHRVANICLTPTLRSYFTIYAQAEPAWLW